MKSFKIYILIRLIFLLQWFLFLSCKKEFLGEKLDDKSYVFLFWHGKLALMPFIFKKLALGSKKVFVMISEHKDGELIAKNIELFGINSIRGSTYKGASSVLRSSFKVLDEKNCIAITPDGPRGPYHSIADGCVNIAQKKDVDIVILNYEASRYWEFKSWDKMILPKPFSKIRYRILQPFSLKNLEKDEAKKIIKEKFDMISTKDSFSKDT